MKMRSLEIRSLFALASALLPGALCAAEPNSPPPPGAVIRLWDGAAPNAPENAPAEVTGDDERVRNVSVPTLTAYLPDKARATGTAIIVCSGGGYTQLAVKKHGETAAAAFVPRGIAVFALKYRLRPISKDVVADALADGERAVRLVRSRAKEWNINPHRIGIIGYSVGANLILNLLSNFDDGAAASTDAIERESSRPDFAGLFSAWPGSQKIAGFHFSKETPPVYLAHTEDDTTAKVAFARSLEAGMKKAGVSVKADDARPFFGGGGGFHRDFLQTSTTTENAHCVTLLNSCGFQGGPRGFKSRPGHFLATAQQMFQI